MGEKYFDYDNDDYFVEKKMSELKRERNAFLAIGFVLGIASTFLVWYVYMWATLGH